MNHHIFNNPMQNKLDTLKKRLYQLIISRLDGDKIRFQGYRDHIISLVHKGIGGFIIFGGERDEIKRFIEELQANAEIPLFIASDIERGVGQQIKGCTNFPCQMAVASAIDNNNENDKIVLQNMLKAIAEESIDVGINMPLIPVMDVNKNPDNPIICTRAFSDSPEKVAWFGCQFIKTIQSSGLICCAKHFPGHGDTSIDSHILLPIISKTKSDLVKEDIMPFEEAIRANIASIMIGHLFIQELDSKPASLSRKIVTDLLKKELGFKGLVLTDALNMNALKDLGNILARCINAGADILLHPVDVDKTVEELLVSLKTKEINERHIDEALKKILDTKNKLKFIKKTEVNYLLHETISRHITEMSISLIKYKSGILPIKDFSKARIIFVGETDNYNTDILKRHCGVNSENSPDVTIFTIFTTVSAWKGTSGIGKEEILRVNNMIKDATNPIVVSFGSPYVLRHFKSADILISAYEPTEQSQIAVAKCLNGEISFKGQLPINF